MMPRTVGAIALRPTGNAQGNFYFFSLATGKRINRTHATKLPMPDEVIERVHLLARRQKANPGLIFGDRNEQVNPMDDEYEEDDSDDESYAPEEDQDEDEYDDDDNEGDEDDSSDDESYDPNDDPDGDDDGDDEWDDGADPADEEGEANDVSADDAEAAAEVDEDEDVSLGKVPDGGDMEPAVIEPDDEAEESAGVETAEIPGVRDEIPGVGDADPETAEIPGVGGADPEQDADDITDNDAEGEPHHGYNLRRNRTRGYSHRYGDEYAYTLTTAGVVDPMEKELLSTPQMSMKQGIKMFGEKGVAAVKSEMQQLHTRKVMTAKKPTELTPAQKREALAYLMFLKRKRCGKVKGRGCADGRKQRLYTAKEDASSPTVSTEAVFITAVIDALEGRDVAVVDVPGAFMQADMDEEVYVRFTGKMVELLLEIDRDMYQECVTMERGEKVMYVKLLKALYGTLRAARLFWEKLSAKLVEWGFQMNPYDACVANKTVNGRQLTVAWHVDDLKISHVDTPVVDQFIEQMNSEFGRETEMNISRGKVHDYLGMTLDFTKPGCVMIKMADYVRMMLRDSPRDMEGSAVTPAANHLFNINNTDPILLTGERKDLFVHLVMQALYLSQRGRPDIRTAVSFLCTQINCPDMDDYKKLGRMMKYLRTTVDMPLTLSADGSRKLRWWVDASYSVHPDMKGHTGGTFLMGKGSVYSTSSKQKMNTRSSTESEVVGVYDCIPPIRWTTLFIEAQGFPVDDTILFQDNMSAMLLEKNGKSSSTKRTKHMHIRFFYIADMVKQKQISIEHCPTEVMLADYFTKPLQGKLFQQMRDQIMGIGPNATEAAVAHRSVLSVGENNDVTTVEVENPESKRMTYRQALMNGGEN